jgi:hypothetical protein
LSDLFEELVSIPALIKHENLVLEVVLIQEEEIRHADGRGSWRRRGQSVHAHKLVQVLETVKLEKKEDFLRFLPEGLEQPFTNQSLAERIGGSIHATRRMTYGLKKMDVIQAVRKKGSQLLFQVAAEKSARLKRNSEMTYEDTRHTSN